VNAARRAALHAALDCLLPADEDGPGAVALGAGSYIERALGAEHAGSLEAYERGLDALDASALAVHDARFAALESRARDEVLGDAGAFLELLRTHAIEGCFGDPRWGGNAGGAGWALLGYPGPREQWSEREQELR
jgi:hypothetical protein